MDKYLENLYYEHESVIATDLVYIKRYTIEYFGNDLFLETTGIASIRTEPVVLDGARKESPLQVEAYPPRSGL